MSESVAHFLDVASTSSAPTKHPLRSFPAFPVGSLHPPCPTVQKRSVPNHWELPEMFGENGTIMGNPGNAPHKRRNNGSPCPQQVVGGALHDRVAI